MRIRPRRAATQMTSESKPYRHNHYVPEWYQKRFISPKSGTYYYLDLKPDLITQGDYTHSRRALRRLGARNCFAQDDLYTVKWGVVENVDIEKFFFGEVDNTAPAAVQYFSEFAHPSADGELFQTFLTHMSLQKLRTPKGLGWLRQWSTTGDRNLDLILIQQIKNVFCATWTECIWQIADSNNSKTKFIISDHPVTVYNRACPPLNDLCRGYNDPDIRLSGTHTIYPLSLEKMLILTNLSWVRNPYQSEKKLRPNPELFRNTIFNFLDIQTSRSMSEEEVLQINYIVKKRALKYVAAAEEEWLYPEKFLASDHWRNFGRGHLLMPDPRDIHMGGEIVIGYSGGGSDAFSEYGHKPWQQGYKDEKRFAVEAAALERFKAEFARVQGPVHRGTSHTLGAQGRGIDGEEMQKYYQRKDAEHRRADRKRRG
jgi:hypothetical protein